MVGIRQIQEIEMSSVDWDDYAGRRLEMDERNYLENVWEVYLAMLANPAFCALEPSSAFKKTEQFMSQVYKRYNENEQNEPSSFRKR